MSLSFQPETEEQVLNLLKDGVYDFSVSEAKDAISKRTGNPMIKLTLVIWDKNGDKRFITDYIMTSYMRKLKHFCDATGLIDKYNEGSLTATDCLDKTGKLKLVIKNEIDSPYPPQNEVQDYVKKESVIAQNGLYKTMAEVANNATEFKDDVDIPF